MSITCGVMLTVDTNTPARPDSGSIQRRHVTCYSSVVVAAVRMTKTVARCITHKILQRRLINKDQSSRPRTWDEWLATRMLYLWTNDQNQGHHHYFV